MSNTIAIPTYCSYMDLKLVGWKGGTVNTLGIVPLFDGRVMGMVVAQGRVQDRCTRGGRPDSADGWHESG